ncbi:MAG: hypothetical protein AB7O67_16660 [Vicinamibacterales bacterium]
MADPRGNARLAPEDVTLVPARPPDVSTVLRAVRRALYGGGTEELRQWPEARGLAADIDNFAARAVAPCPRCERARENADG